MNQPRACQRFIGKLLTLFVSLFVVLGLVFVALPEVLQTQAASAPNIVSYQGRVLNANGVPVTDTSLDIVFLLYDASSGGSCVWSNSSASCATTTAKAVTITDGLFSENLGDTGASYAAIGDSIFGDNASLYLEVRIEGETLSPRKQITAAPYALNADTLDGIDSTGFLAADGDTGTGDFDFTGAIFMGASPLVFEGSSDDGNQTTFTITDPSGANTITVPDSSGTLALTSDVSLTGAYGGGQTMTIDATGDAVFNLTGTTDFLINDSGVNFFTFADDSTLSFTPTTTTGTAFTITGSSVTSGDVLALNATGVTSGKGLNIIVDQSLDNSTGAGFFLDYETGSGNEEVDQVFVIESDCAGDAGCSSFSDDNEVFSIMSTGEVFTDVAVQIGSTRYQQDSIAGTGAFTIGSGGSGDLNLESAGSSILINSSDDFIVGSATVSSAPFGVDESTNTVYIGEGSGTSAALIMKASDGDEGTIDYSTSDQWEFTGGNVDIGQSLAVGLDAGILSNEVFTLGQNQSSGFVSNALGSFTSTIGASGTTFDGLNLSLTNNGGASAVTNLHGINIDLDTNNAGATTTTAMGLDIDVGVTAGTGTTNYGLRASASGATNNYAGYFYNGQVFFDNDTTPDTTNAISGGAGDVYIRDQLEIGGTDTTTGVVIGARVDELTSGIGFSLVRPSGGSNFTNSSTGLANFGVTDSGGSGNVLFLDQDGSGSALIIDQDGDTGTTLAASNGGALHIGNDNNAHSAFTIYSNEGSGASAGLVHWKIDNTAYDQDVLVIENDSTDSSSSALFINGGGGAPAIDVDTNVADFAISIFNDGNNDNRQGIDIQACADSSPTGACDFIAFSDGNGTKLGAIEANGTAVTNASTGSDYAELFPGTLNAYAQGDVFGLSSTGEVILAQDGSKMIGAYSVAPNVLGNWKENWQELGTYVPIGLLGQVPVNVNTEGGAIEAGDYLTLSSTPGVVTKANGPAFMLGQALESHASGEGQIMVFIEPKWHALDSIQDDNGVVIADTLALGSIGIATASTVYDSQAFSLRGSAWDGSQAVERSMTIQNDVTTTTDYQLSISNTDGNEVAFVNQAGDLAIAGKLYPSDRGTLQTDKYIYYDGSAGPGGNFMRTNAAGWATGSYDFAEMFPSLDTLVPGEVVVFAQDNEHIARSGSRTYDPGIAGIVSTQPGFLAGENIAGHAPIALAGRVPTFVTSENGPIAVGDPLTTSSLAGYAMKATEPGQIVGYAMESMTDDSGSIIVFVRPSYYDGSPVGDLPGVDNEASGLAGSISDFGNTNRLDLATGSIINIGSLMGIGGNWQISELGDILTEGRITHLITSYQGEEVETFVPVARETTVQLSGSIALKNGFARVDFEYIDPLFNDIISNEHEYRVFLTASSPTNPLYATNREQDGFRIREADGSSHTTVDWLVIAYHKDYAPEDIGTEDTIADTNSDVIGEEDEEEPVEDMAPTEETEDPIKEEPVEEPEDVQEEETVEEDPVLEEGATNEEIVTEQESATDEEMTEEDPVEEVIAEEESPQEVQEETVEEAVIEEPAEESVEDTAPAEETGEEGV